MPALALSAATSASRIWASRASKILRPVRVFRVVTETQPVLKPAPPLPLPDKPSIAVLPFANMSGDPEQEYFADGMVEAIITALFEKSAK
jgi:hypothetical protein